MARKRRSKMAFIYDFDGTLAPGNMQEYELLKKLDIKPKVFWNESKQRAKEHDMDTILSYMTLMIEKCRESKNVRYTKADLRAYGKTISLFDGVESWFKLIDDFSKTYSIKVDHFIVSSGIKEMIEGTKIAKHFKQIYASSYKYDHNDVPEWPANAINYSAKTQFIFRISKGVLDVWDNDRINDVVPEEERNITYNNMIYFGDGLTDVPCMKLVKDYGGISIAVFKPNSKKGRKIAERLLSDERVNAIFPANYSEDSPLANAIKARIIEVSARTDLWRALR